MRVHLKQERKYDPVQPCEAVTLILWVTVCQKKLHRNQAQHHKRVWLYLLLNCCEISYLGQTWRPFFLRKTWRPLDKQNHDRAILFLVQIFRANTTVSLQIFRASTTVSRRRRHADFFLQKHPHDMHLLKRARSASRSSTAYACAPRSNRRLDARCMRRLHGDAAA